MGFSRDCLKSYRYHHRIESDYGMTIFSRDQEEKPKRDECPDLIIGGKITPLFNDFNITPSSNKFRTLDSNDPLVQTVNELKSRNIFINGLVDAKHLHLLAAFVREFDYKSDYKIYITDDFSEDVPELVRIDLEERDLSKSISFNHTSTITPYFDPAKPDEVFSNELFKQLLPILNPDQLANWLEKKIKADVSVFPLEDGLTKSDLLKVAAEIIDLPDHLIGKMHLKSLVRYREENVVREEGDLTSSHYNHGEGKISLSDAAMTDRQQLIKDVFHEIGHSLVKNLGQVYKDFVALSWDNNRMKLEAKFVTRYAETDPEEDFCESFAYYFFNPSRLQQKAPEKYALLRDRVFNGIEYQDHTHPRYVFTQSLYKDKSGKMIVDRDEPILQTPNENLWMSISETSNEKGEIKTKVKVILDEVVDNYELKGAVLFVRINGEKALSGSYGKLQDGRWIFSYEIDGKLEDFKFEDVTITDRAGNKGRHLFPNQAEIELGPDGKVKFYGNLDRMGKAQVSRLTEIPSNLIHLEPGQVVIVPRDDISIPGKTFEIILDGVEFDPNQDYLKLTWINQQNYQPLDHSFFHEFHDEPKPVVKIGENGKVRLLVHFHSHVPVGDYKLEPIEIFRNGKKYRYILSDEPKITIGTKDTKQRTAILPGKIEIINRGNVGSQDEVEFDLLIPYRSDLEDIMRVRVDVRYNEKEDIDLSRESPRVITHKGKKFFAYRFTVPSVSAKVEVKAAKVFYDDYKDIDMSKLSPDQVPGRTRYESSQEINFSQRFIYPGQSIQSKE